MVTFLKSRRRSHECLKRSYMSQRSAQKTKLSPTGLDGRSAESRSRKDDIAKRLGVQCFFNKSEDQIQNEQELVCRRSQGDVVKCRYRQHTRHSARLSVLSNRSGLQKQHAWWRNCYIHQPALVLVAETILHLCQRQH